jgi:uncharacterized membrane protein
MTELMVAGFNDAYRAAQVLHELRRIDWDESTDLDHAVCVARQEDGRIQVQQTVDPSDADSVIWPALWSALITTAMVTTDPLAMPAAAVSSGLGAGTVAEGGALRSGPFPPVGWWTKDVGISHDFLRDLGAVLMPGSSIVMLLVRSATPRDFATRLRRTGATVLRQPLDPGQVAQIQEMLDKGPIEPRSET